MNIKFGRPQASGIELTAYYCKPILAPKLNIRSGVRQIVDKQACSVGPAAQRSEDRAGICLVPIEAQGNLKASQDSARW
jgi:hypothetical protein